MLVVVILLSVRAWQSPAVALGDAPPIDRLTLQGQPASLSLYRGEPLLILFWAEWCRVCRIEMPVISKLAKDKQVLTIAIQSGDDEAVWSFLQQEGLDSLPVVNDQQGALARDYGIRGVPAMFILDGKGQIRFIETGLTSGWGLRARMWWAGK
ncbi:protein disulfide oxidoreductase [Nitrincola alkalilacustris]|uniref:protein disulfide oxidoreductase n=1 Tax=Nitrincola alkalilacustris TaxID=1571224 RepID=UPI001456F4BA|nr:protein disulfide oxidoreductase [Nitrincola alkalilacustris]